MLSRVLRAQGRSVYAYRSFATARLLLQSNIPPKGPTPKDTAPKITPPVTPPVTPHSAPVASPVVSPAAYPAATPLDATVPVPTKKKKRFGFFKSLFYILGLGTIATIGSVTYAIYRENNPIPQVPQSAYKPNGNRRRTLVIIGSGWGAVTALKNLDTTLFNVIVVSPRNYFLFTPLLPSVPTGTVDIKSIIDPVRTVAKQTPGEVQYLQAKVTDIDPLNKCISIEHKSSGVAFGDVRIKEEEPLTTKITYDYVLYAVGAEINTFGIKGIYENASFLKEAEDATAVRTKIFNAMEASRLLPPGSPERKRLLSVVVCGGGPTGVELAAEVKDYIDQDLAKFIPNIENEMTVTLIEALPNVLNMFNPKLIEYTCSVFKTQHLDLRTNTAVTEVDNRNVYVNAKKPNGEIEKQVIPYGTLVWAGGNKQRPITTKLQSCFEEQKGARRGLLVDEHLKLDGDTAIYAIGDCTFTKNAPTAQVAHQQGIYVAKQFELLSQIDDLKYFIKKAEDAGDTEQVEKLNRRMNRLQSRRKPFEYKHQGALAYIGSERAVADLTWGSWSTIATGGSLTFLFWRTAYVQMILGTRNKILVVADWIKVAVFGRDCSKD